MVEDKFTAARQEQMFGYIGHRPDSNTPSRRCMFLGGNVVNLYTIMGRMKTLDTVLLRRNASPLSQPSFSLGSAINSLCRLTLSNKVAVLFKPSALSLPLFLNQQPNPHSLLSDQLSKLTAACFMQWNSFTTTNLTKCILKNKYSSSPPGPALNHTSAIWTTLCCGLL